jgi:hypothetical protein
MIEELAAHLLGVDTDDEWENLDELLVDKFNIDMDSFDMVVGKLVPLIEMDESPLTGDLYKGFADRDNGLWLLKVGVKR